jgi:hypothetical protein
MESSLFAGESLADDFRVLCETEILSSSLVAAGVANSEFAELKSIWSTRVREEMNENKWAIKA